MFLIAPEDGCRAVRVPGGAWYMTADSVALSLNFPWFMACVSSRMSQDAWQTVLLGLDRALVSLARDPSRGVITSLLAFAPRQGPVLGWDAREIAEVWLAEDGEQAVTGPLLLRPAESHDLFTCWNERVAARKAGRNLLLRLEPSSHW